MPDGSITFSTQFDNAQLEKELARLKKKVLQFEEEAGRAGKHKNAFVEQYEQAIEKYKEYAKLHSAGIDKETGGHLFDEADKATADSLYSTADAIYKKIEKCDDQIKQSNIDLEYTKERYAEIAAEIESMRLTESQNVEIIAGDKSLGNLAKSSNKAEKSLENLDDELQQKPGDAGNAADAIDNMSDATTRASSVVDRFTNRLQKMVSRVFVFTVITSALRSLRTWLGKAVKTNSEATAAIARLKGALLTLAQPLVNVLIPAFTSLVNILTRLANIAASLMSRLFGATAKESAEAAETLYDEQNALDDVGDAAKKASKSLAGFDEINQISGDSSNDTASVSVDIVPDFSEAGDLSWLQETLGAAAGWVTAALMLGGIAFVAIGACTGNLGLITAGLLALGAGIEIGTETGVLQSWAETLGLSSVEEFVTIALMLGGIALVAIGAITGNVLLVIAGLGLLGAGVAVGEESGTLQSWSDTLGLNNVGEYVAIALLLAGVAFVAIGAMTGNILMILAGLGMLGADAVVGKESGVLQSWVDALGLNSVEEFITAGLLLGGLALVAIGAITGNIITVVAGLGILGVGVVVGTESGALQNWAAVLGLDSVFEYVAVAVQLGGIALIAIGVTMGNIAMAVAGMAILSAGLFAELVGEETLKDWWEVLKLTTVQQWVSVALLLGGIALVAIGAATANILMVIGGMALLGLGTIVAASSGNLQDWVTTLGLEKVVGWVTAGLLLAGLVLIVFGICTANILMVMAGIGLLGAGVSVGVTSGTFASWIETIINGLKTLVQAVQNNVINPLVDAFKWLRNSVVGIIDGIINGFIGIINGFIGGINNVIGTINKIPGVSLGKISPLQTVSIPRLAEGAVIPPNREFMAVLGDQKWGTNIEAPAALIKQMVMEAMREMGGGGGSGNSTVILQIDGEEFGRFVYKYGNRESQRVGVSLVED